MQLKVLTLARKKTWLQKKLIVMSLCGVIVTATASFLSAESIQNTQAFEFEERNVGILPASFDSEQFSDGNLDPLNGPKFEFKAFEFELTPQGPIDDDLAFTFELSPNFQLDISSAIYNNHLNKLTPLKSLPTEQFKGSPWEISADSSFTTNLAYKLHVISDQILKLTKGEPWTGYQWFLVMCLVSLTLSLVIGLFSTHDYMQKELLLFLQSSGERPNQKLRIKKTKSASHNRS